jgi:cystathionine gamma-synthase
VSTHQDWSDAGFSTRAIHAGQDPDPTTGAVVVPVHLTSTYKQDGVGGLRGGYEYTRSGNPTRAALEAALAAAETPRGGTPARGFAFASGLAAEDTLLRAVLRPGDHVVLPDDAYGGSFRLIARSFGAWGVEHTAVDLTDLDAVAAAIRPTTRVLWVETPTNPLLGISDVAALAAVARDAGALLVVDNTFASPYLQQPIALGADVVVHSTTKYVGGHSDVVGGALVVADGATMPGGREALNGGNLVADAVAFGQNASGAVAGPFDSWLTLRGLKTLAVRMERHQANAMAVARFLEQHPRVEQVIYPGLESHPGHALAKKQMRGFGGMVSFRVGSEDKALEVVDRTQVFLLAESLGGVESLIEHPGRMTHASVAGSALEVPADLVRLSVGIEDAEDLVADLDSALG